METFVDKIEEKMTEVKEKLKKNLEDAINDFQQRWMRQQEKERKDDDNSEEDDQKQYMNPIEQRLDIRPYSEEYIKSIDYQKGREVDIDMPQFFRKDSKSVEIKIEGIQFKFCDGVLSDFQKERSDRSIPLVLFKFDNLQFDIWQIDHDLSFDPLTGMKSQAIS